jgi:hypothetical protein
MAEQNLMVLTRRVESKIRVMRGRKVIFDSDLAELYGVAVKRLNQQVKRNTERFPTDFVFRVKEGDLRLQIATSKAGSGRGLEKGAPPEAGGDTCHLPSPNMAATVLNSKRAVEMSIFVVRAFVRMREVLATNQKIVVKLKDLEKRVGNHDGNIQRIVAAIHELMKPPAAPGRRIGFKLPLANV